MTVGDVDFDRGDFGPLVALSPVPHVLGAPRAAPIRSTRQLNATALPGTRGEVEAIGRAFRLRFTRGVNLHAVSGGQATKERLLDILPTCRVIHLATHGYFASEEYQTGLESDEMSTAPPGKARSARAGLTTYYPGLLSGLIFAGANAPPKTTSGGLDVGSVVMTAEEIGDLDLSRCDLVVLSACETGLGAVAGGQGVLGLQTAFHKAGARTVIASLWKVDDDATSALMARFYDNLWRKEMPKAEAFRQAQIAMIRGELDTGPAKDGRGMAPGVRVSMRNDPKDKRVPPRFWAAFVLSGDGR